MTLEHDEQLDSRQPVEGDPGSLVAHKTMSESLLWWMTTTSLVDAILDSAGPDAFALVIGPRSVVELKSDGSLRRARLDSFLEGGVGTVRIKQSQMNTPLPASYRSVHTLPSSSGTERFTVGVDVGAPGKRWRFLRGAPFFDLFIQTIAPTVIVDAAPGSIFSHYGLYEVNRLVDGITLVLPHTQATERFLRGLLDWMERGRPHEDPWWFGQGPWTQSGHSSWWEAKEATAVAVPTSAEFGVSGLFRDWQWREPDNLEAARAFVQSRFDLRIGIWDLEGSPPLRASLLAPASATERASEPASVPSGSARRTAQREDAKVADDDRRREAHVAACEQFDLLFPLGWKLALLRPGAHESFLREYFRLWLTQPVERYGRNRTPSWLSFEINPRSTCACIGVFVDNQFELSPYLAPKRGLLEEIAAPGECDLSSKFRAVLWRAEGGWRDEVDWPERLAELGAKTPLWLEVFADLPQTLSENRRL